MEPNYYKEYYILERNNWWFKARSYIISKQIKKLNLPTNAQILNVGAATFKSSEMLNSYGKVTSAEYDKGCCDFVTKELGKEMVNCSATEMPFEDNSFDMVCAFDVIEHIEDHEIALKEMDRVLKIDGVMFITVPAFQFLWSSHDDINHHFRRYTKGQLKDLFVKNIKKSSIVKLSYFNSILFLPILLMRRISSINKNKKPKKKKSDFKKFEFLSGLEKIFYWIFKSEAKLLSVINFPLGVSLMIISKNKIND